MTTHPLDFEWHEFEDANDEIRNRHLYYNSLERYHFLNSVDEIDT